MSKKEFNDNSSLPLISFSHGYTIEPAYPANCNAMTEALTFANLMDAIKGWILKETGCLPAIEVIQPDPDAVLLQKDKIQIHCTPAFIRKLAAVFEGRIEKITRLPTREEVIAKDGPDICWKPPRL